jgi:hypothetical protein
VGTREELSLVVDDDGTVAYVDFGAVERDVILGLVSEATTVHRERASHVLPVDPVERAAFRALRRVFGDEGPVADWTRTWQGFWEVDLRPIGGPVLPTWYYSHSDGVEAERGWLAENIFPTEDA